MSANRVFASLPVLESLARAVMSLEDPECWRAWLQLCVALPCFGRYSLHMWVQREAKDRFTRMKERGFSCDYLLPCGKLHHDNDQPAVNHANGHKEWWVNGKRHRDNDQPVVIYAGGTKEWWVHGKLHRDNDLPAVIFSNGGMEWWVYDKRHRDNDQPAVTRADGSKAWWVHGKQHRDNDQPAVIYADGSKKWWVEGKHVK